MNHRNAKSIRIALPFGPVAARWTGIAGVALAESRAQEGAQCRGVRLGRGGWHDARLAGGILRNVVMKSASSAGAGLEGADLRGINPRFACLECGGLTGALYYRLLPMNGV